jgi:uncharacterized protein (DUF849 family)
MGKYSHIVSHRRTPEDEIPVPDPWIQPRWKIPEAIAINVGLSGGGFFTEQSNPHFPTDLDRIKKEAEECIEAGATIIHFDHEAWQIKPKPGEAPDFPASYRQIIQPLVKKYGRDKFLIDANILRGKNFDEMLAMTYEGLNDMAYINPLKNPVWVRAAVETLQENNCKPELLVSQSHHIEIADRLLIKPGLLQKPYFWIILIGSPLLTERRNHIYVPNAKAMCQSLLYLVERIKEVEEDSIIIVCSSGRACRFMATQSMLLGLHIRVGMEDTVWRYPHKDEMIERNVDELRDAIEIARLHGIGVLTAKEFRKQLGLKES